MYLSTKIKMQALFPRRRDFLEMESVGMWVACTNWSSPSSQTLCRKVFVLAIFRLCREEVQVSFYFVFWGSNQFGVTRVFLSSFVLFWVETSLEWQEYFSRFQDTTGALPCHVHLPVFLWIMDSHSSAPKKKYKSWEWGTTARYYASHTKTMLPTRKSMPRSSRQSDHTKTSWPWKRYANCSGMVMSHVHQVWPKPFCKAQ